MGDFQRVDPKGWEYDLHSVYSAYVGHFQVHNIPWYDRTWGHLFEDFQEFLAYSWPTVVVTDLGTSKAHVVTRASTIAAFVKMVKTRFGDTLPQVNNILRVVPFETTPRRLHTIADYNTYKRVYATLPAAVLSAARVRVRAGEPATIRTLWERREKTFLAVDIKWSERNPLTALEWGYAAVRCGHLVTLGAWPPDPETNYRKGHYVVDEYINQGHNKVVPNNPWQYKFGDTQRIPKVKLPMIIRAIMSTLMTPDSEVMENDMVLVGHGISSWLPRLEEMKIKLPHNVLTIDTALFERQLFVSGARGPMTDGKTGAPRTPDSALSLGNTLRSIGVDIRVPLHNAGNDAFLVLLAFQLLLDPAYTAIPPMVGLRRGPVSSPIVTPPAPGPSSGPVPAVSPSVPMFPSGIYHGRTPSPAGLSPTNGYFGAQQDGRPISSVGTGLGGSYRASRSHSVLMPDEVGVVPRSKSADRLSRSMRDLSMG